MELLNAYIAYVIVGANAVGLWYQEIQCGTEAGAVKVMTVYDMVYDCHHLYYCEESWTSFVLRYVPPVAS